MKVPTAILLVYTVFLLLLGYLEFRRKEGLTGFLVANRKASTLQVAFSMIATCVGGTATIGIAGNVLVKGFPAIWWLLSGALGLLVLALSLAKTVRQTQAMTLQCYVDTALLEKARAALGTENVPLQVRLSIGDDELRTFGPVSLSLTAEQSRYFDFGHARYRDKELDKEIEIVGLELTPFSAVWKVSYEGAASFHTPEADWDAYRPWSMLEDKVCIETKLVFSDGSTFSTGGAMTTPYENGTVNLFCGWGSAINIDDVQRIILGDIVLWEAE